jgi:RNA polymerase sigma-70 factor, ECF subfamily
MNRLDLFNQHRSLLFGISYRMLGSVTEAEDIVQEAWIRWQSTDSIVQSPKAFLSSVVTRLCIDHLRSARVKREQYTGTWLPEPLITEPTPYLLESR